MGRDTPLRAEVVDGELVIRIGVEVLAFAAMEKQKHEMNVTYRVTDVDEFAEENLRALTHEEEDGSSPLTNLLDAAIEAALDDGPVSVEFIEPARTEMCPACCTDGCKACDGLGYVVGEPEGEDPEFDTTGDSG